MLSVFDWELKQIMVENQNTGDKKLKAADTILRIELC